MASKYICMQRLCTLVSQSHHMSSTKSCHPHSITSLFHSPSRCHYHIVSPGNVSALRKGPDSIPKPAYAVHGNRAVVAPKEVEIKTPDQIEGMRRACALAASLLQFTGSYLQVGLCSEPSQPQLTYPLTMRVVGAPQMISHPGCSNFSVLHCPLGLGELQACPFPDVFFPPLPLPALSSSPFHCALQDSFGQT